MADYRSPNRTMGTPRAGGRGLTTPRPYSPNNRTKDSPSYVSDIPIQEFSSILARLPADEWKARCMAFDELIDGVPSDLPLGDGGSSSSGEWYSSALTLRRLAMPVSSLLLDPRSSVVKRVCGAGSTLFHRVQSRGRHLLKDLLPAVMQAHGQTVAVIRTYVQGFMSEIIPVCPSSGCLPVFLERLKQDKSRTIREACAFYLGISISSWSSTLSDDAVIPVGTGLVKALRDSSPSVRGEARTALDKVRESYPQVWEVLLRDESGILAKDARLRRMLASSGNQNGDDTSNRPLSRTNSPNLPNSTRRSLPHKEVEVKPTKPKSLLSGPPQRISKPGFRRNSNEYTPPKESLTNNKETATKITHVPRSLPSFNSVRSLDHTKHDDDFELLVTPPPRKGTITSSLKNEIKNEATPLRRSSSLQLQKRWNDASGLPEHQLVAQQLVERHKSHVEELMETIKLEMDLIRDMEKNEHPSEEDVLDYYEAVHLCLEQRTQSGDDIRKAMEYMSRGEKPPSYESY